MRQRDYIQTWMAQPGLPVELANHVPGYLVRAEGNSVPVGYSEFGKIVARWSLEAELLSTERPPGIDAATFFFSKRFFFATASKYTAKQAQTWADEIIEMIREGKGTEAAIDWRRTSLPSPRLRSLQAQLPWNRVWGRAGRGPDGCKHILTPITGYPSLIGEIFEARVDDAQWWIRFAGWHVDQKPSTEGGWSGVHQAAVCDDRALE